MTNSKKGILNILSGIANQFITIALGLILTRLVLVSYGSEVNGLLNTINLILSYVALLESGVGAVSLQSLYKPISQHDGRSVNCILSATNIFYKRTGIIYFVVVCLLSVILPFTIKTTLNWLTVMLVMFISGMPGVISYYFYAKYRIFLEADGKGYINNNLSTLVYIGTHLLKIVLLLLGFDVVVLQAMYFAFSLLQMVYYAVYIKKKYTWMNLKAEPDFSSISQSKNALVHEVGGLIFNNTDTLILTFFCGLGSVSLYSMYMYFFSMIRTAISHFSGISFALGQAFNNDRKHFLKLYDAYEVFNMNLTFSLFCLANLLVLPFMKLYTAGVTDINYIDNYLPYLFIITFLLSCGRNSSNLVIKYAKHFKETQVQCIVESVINVVVSLTAVSFLGIYGVLIGTIAALLYRSNDMIIYASRKILHRSSLITYRRWALNFLIYISCLLIGKGILENININSYFKLIFVAIIASIIIVPLFFTVSLLLERQAARTMLHYIKSITKVKQI